MKVNTFSIDTPKYHLSLSAVKNKPFSEVFSILRNSEYFDEFIKSSELINGLNNRLTNKNGLYRLDATITLLSEILSFNSDEKILKIFNLLKENIIQRIRIFKQELSERDDDLKYEKLLEVFDISNEEIDLGENKKDSKTHDTIDTHDINNIGEVAIGDYLRIHGTYKDTENGYTQTSINYNNLTSNTISKYVRGFLTEYAQYDLEYLVKHSGKTNSKTLLYSPELYTKIKAYIILKNRCGTDNITKETEKQIEMILSGSEVKITKNPFTQREIVNV